MLFAPWWAAKVRASGFQGSPAKWRPIQTKQTLSAFIHRRRRFLQSSPFTTRNDNLKPGRRSFDFRHFTPLCDAHHARQWLSATNFGDAAKRTASRVMTYPLGV